MGLQKTAPGSGESVGIAERMHRTVKEKITTLLLSLGIESKPTLWPWMSGAATECINFTSSLNRGGKSPIVLRNALLIEHGLDPVPTPKRVGFGEPVLFRTPREKTRKDRERLPNGSRMGLYLSQPHNGLTEILGFQNERLVIWLVHPSLVSSADITHTARLLRDCTYYATSYDDNDIRQIIVNKHGKVGPEHLFSYPYIPTEGDDITEVIETNGRMRKKRLRVLGTSEKRHLKKRVMVRRVLRALPKRAAGSFFTLTTIDEDGTEYVAITPVHKHRVLLQRVQDGKLDCSYPPRVGNFDYVSREGTPSILQESGNVLKSVRRTGSRGHFHLRYGYIADDEAPPEMVDAGKFDEADLKEWQSILENGVLGPETTPPDGVRPCRTRFRRTLKTTATHEIVEKSRFLVCETKDDRPVEISTEMPTAWMRRMVVVMGLSRGWTAATIDIKTAFLLVPLPPEHGDIFVRLPSHLPQCIRDLGFAPKAVHKLNKSLYG